MRILVISRFPPDRDGIASYAVQLVTTLRRSGHMVRVVSPYPSAAMHCADFKSTIGLLRVLLLSWRADRSIVQFVADHFFKSLGGVDFVTHWPAFALLLAFGRNVELVIHEAPYTDLTRIGPPKGWLVRAMWRAMVRLPRRTFVHTDWEREQLAKAINIDRKHIGLLDHGKEFVRRTHAGRSDARIELGIPADEFVFLCIGFLQVHKGFDRAIQAFKRLAGRQARLEVVGSMRVPAPEIEAHVHQLRMLAATTPSASLHEGYVTDEEFDRWIVASDAVVLPYRDIWSSGVVERAKLYGSTLIVSDAGGLPEQGGMFAHVISNDDELASAMAEVAGMHVLGIPDSRSSAYIRPIVDEVRGRAAILRRRVAGRRAQPDALGDTVGDMPLPLRLPFVGGRHPRDLVKRVVFALTRWELRPIVNRINELQYRTDSEIALLQRQLNEVNRTLSAMALQSSTSADVGELRLIESRAAESVVSNTDLTAAEPAKRD